MNLLPSSPAKTAPVYRSRKEQIPILLANANYYGTLAAVRSLGRAGIPVSTMHSSRLSLAGSSRYTKHHLKCPDFERSNEWAEWLARMGRAGPRSAVYATSDAVLFAIALHHDELSKSFALYQPGLETVLKILDKAKLLESASEAGIDTPETWQPKTAIEAGKIARDIGGPLLIKPRSQLSQRTLTKGAVVDGNERQAAAMFNRYVDDASHDSAFAKSNPEALTPVLQRFYPEAVESVYSLTGFRHKCGQMVFRGALKTLQMPRQIGVGLCFEDAPIYPDLVHSASRLCEQIGYFGVFELEFIFAGRKRLLIDFNGRFFNQIGLDVERGMNLPVMAHAATSVTPEELSQIMVDEAGFGDRCRTAFCNELELTLTINMHRLFGSISREEANRWKARIAETGSRTVDAVYDPEDPLPRVVAIARNLLNISSHPRAFIRQYRLKK